MHKVTCVGSIRNHFKVDVEKKPLKKAWPTSQSVVLMEENTCSLFQLFFLQCWKKHLFQNIFRGCVCICHANVV